MQTYQFEVLGNERVYIPNLTLTGGGFRVSISPNNQYQNDSLVAYMRTLILIENLWVRLVDRTELTLDQIVLLDRQPVRIELWQLPWVTGYTVTITTYTEFEIMNSSYATPSNQSTRPVSSTKPTSTTSALLAPANPLRAGGGIIVNTSSNRNLWVLFPDPQDTTPTATTATLNDPSILVPKGRGNIGIPEGYTGAIYGVWDGSDANGRAAITEFLQ